MLSRILWVGLAGFALVAGMVIQDRYWIFGWNDRSIDSSIDRTVDRTVDRAVDRSVDHMQVVGPNGHEVAVSRETKRAMAQAVGRLVKAEADHAVLRIGDASEQEMQAANARRNQARADVDRLKAQIQDQEAAARLEQGALRDQIRRDVRDDIRATVREAVKE